jgi:hypothetical protein
MAKNSGACPNMNDDHTGAGLEKACPECLEAQKAWSSAGAVLAEAERAHTIVRSRAGEAFKRGEDNVANELRRLADEVFKPRAEQAREALHTAALACGVKL